MEILQIGREDWTIDHSADRSVKWHYSTIEALPDFLEALKLHKQSQLPLQENGEPAHVAIYFGAVVISDTVREEDLTPISVNVEAYAVFLDKGVSILEQEDGGFVKRKRPQTIKIDGSTEEKVAHIEMVAFPGQYGAKLKLPDIDPNPLFKGKVSYQGHVHAIFEGNFGEDFTQLFTYRYNLSSFEVAIELWQEYVKEGNCSIQIELIPIQRGSTRGLLESIFITEEEMQDVYIIPKNPDAGMYSVVVHAKGNGKLKFGAMHWRYSRQGYGEMVLGGKHAFNSQRQEFFSYFNPGDLKPPLNVYFSGYRTAEGFEGFGIMKNLKAPFVLIADPRIEGGAFYTGSDNFESQLEQTLQEALDYLNFDSSQMILSGLSMGSFGALYYASTFNPYGVVVGKPFTNLGDTALGMKLKRPHEFETSADVLLNVTGAAELEEVKALNQRFWDKFSQSDFKDTKFAIAYMENDDYDGTAKNLLIDHFVEHDTHIFTKGYEGRHNDNSRAINQWFMRQFANFLEENFGRKF
ncbi:accessory Sec system protein Asp2 [Streptococcus cameli]